MAPPSAELASTSIAQNIAKLHAATVRIGGKGSVRRKVVRKSKAPAFDEKRLATQLQKLGVSSVPVVDSATLLNNEGEVLTFNDAKVSLSVAANTIVLSGTPTLTQAPKKEDTTNQDAQEPKSQETQPEAEEKTDGRVEDEDSDEDTDDDIPQLEEDKINEGVHHKVSKNEKKVRKAMSTLGLKQAFGFTEMRVQTSNNIQLHIQTPDVMKLASAKGQVTYAVFGKVNVNDTHEAQAKQMMEQIKQMQAKQSTKEDSDDEECPDLAEVNFEQFEQMEQAEAAGLDENDIDLVVKQTGVSKAKAIKALLANESDVVNAIMALSG